MADNLEDLGTYSIFPIEANWVQKPKMDLELARLIIKYVGTSQKLETFTDDVPEGWSLYFTPDEDDHYDLIDFFAARKGRHGGFWLKIPTREFTLKETALSGSTELVVERNFAHLQYQGYERIYIIMNTGDLITREITGTNDDEDNDKLELSLATVTDREITTSNHYFFGRLLLCRFDEDSLIMSYGQNAYPSISVRVVELVKEYP
jgi:hypothetical protein